METALQLDIKRIQGLTDAMFAVAMTILILEIKVPQGLNDEELIRYFSEKTLDELFIFCISFIVLGIFWVASHFHHHLIVQTDKISSWLNILFLMMICIIPFSAALLNHYRYHQLSILFYSSNLVLASVLNYLMLLYAWQKKYIKPHINRKQFYFAQVKMAVPVAVYVLIIPISFLNVHIAIYMFLLPILIHFIPERRLGDETA